MSTEGLHYVRIIMWLLCDYYMIIIVRIIIIIIMSGLQYGKHTVMSFFKRLEKNYHRLK